MISQLAPAFQEGQGVHRPARLHRGAARPARHQRAVQRAAGGHHATRSSCSRSRRTRRRRRRRRRASRSPSTFKARSVYEFSIFDDPDTIEGVRQFIEAGEDARFVPELPLKLVIIDERYVMFGMEDPVLGGSDLTMVVVEHPSLAATLKIAFDTELGARADVRRGARAARRRSRRRHSGVRPSVARAGEGQ